VVPASPFSEFGRMVLERATDRLFRRAGVTLDCVPAPGRSRGRRI